ncbi:MAG: alpha-1,4-glucan--maltose-1-phosphate maltosyltransferase, partial [Cellulomonadaceae bacterium]|nr:alpha-1,4-glucan--maltose-1-phosphate maltosyltransferase [Cellulomonadaceae bacterium]
FTWRNYGGEILEYFGEVAGPAGSNARPSFWPTTHDILPPFLQHSGVAGFAIRAVLAATGSPTWGIYTGYELIENVPRPGVEEQIDNEKYEYKQRNWERAGDIGIALLLGKLNDIRKAHPALQQLRNLTIHTSENENVLAYSRRIRKEHLPLAIDNELGVSVPLDEDDVILTIVSLDPWGIQEATIHLDWGALGILPPEGVDSYAPFIDGEDLLTGQKVFWSAHPYVRLNPRFEVAHVMRLRKA